MGFGFNTTDQSAVHNFTGSIFSLDGCKFGSETECLRYGATGRREERFAAVFLSSRAVSSEIPEGLSSR